LKEIGEPTFFIPFWKLNPEGRPLPHPEIIKQGAKILAGTNTLAFCSGEDR